VGAHRSCGCAEVGPRLTSPPPIGRVYGRRRSRRLKGKKAELFDSGLDRVAIRLPDPPAQLDPLTLFEPRPTSVWLEIGFGGGEHLAAQAAARPDIGLIGCEPFINGVSNLLLLLEEAGSGNVRIFSEDARLLLQSLPPGSIDRAFLLFPDPWPKRRHTERRFANQEALDLLAEVLADGAELLVATDHPILKEWMPPRIAEHSGFRLEGSWTERPEGWPPTRYESKALAAGRKPIYLTYRRAVRALPSKT